MLASSKVTHRVAGLNVLESVTSMIPNVSYLREIFHVMYDYSTLRTSSSRYTGHVHHYGTSDTFQTGYAI